jgi:hypothetical protein
VDQDHNEERIELVLPADKRLVRVARLVASGVATTAGFDVEEVEDLRIAVDELCHLLMSSTDHEISVSFGVVGRCVLARGRAQRRPGTPLSPLNDLSRAIIDSVTDHHELTDRDDELGFAVMKEARGSAQR